MARKVLLTIRRGLKAQLPTLAEGEQGFCTDTEEIYVGTANGNKLVGTGADMFQSIYDTNNDGVVDNADKAHSVPWSGVTGKPSTFTPSTHNHTKAQITDFPSSLPANGGNADSINFQDNRAVDEKPSELNIKSKLSASFKNKTAVGNPPVGASSTYVYILNIAGWSSNEGSGGWPIQIAFGTEGMAYRQATDANTWGSWVKTSNISEIPTKLSQLTKDINFDERYYTESEINTRLSNLAVCDGSLQSNLNAHMIAGKYLADFSLSGHGHNDATTTTTGFMPSADKVKLNGIEAGANKYTHPSSHPASMITGLATVATSGSYNDLTNKPTVPTKTSQLSNDSGFITASSNITGNAATATKLQIARKINGIAFDGTQDITIPGDSGDLVLIEGDYVGNGTSERRIYYSGISNPRYLLISGNDAVFQVMYAESLKLNLLTVDIRCISTWGSSDAVLGTAYGMMDVMNGNCFDIYTALNKSGKTYYWYLFGH